jgi:hypothetical protein
MTPLTAMHGDRVAVSDRDRDWSSDGLAVSVEEKHDVSTLASQGFGVDDCDCDGDGHC